VQNALHCGHFLGSLRGRATGHDRFLVPAKPARDLPQSFGFALVGHQVVKCRHGLAPNGLWQGIYGTVTGPHDQNDQNDRAKLMRNREVPRRGIHHSHDPDQHLDNAHGQTPAKAADVAALPDLRPRSQPQISPKNRT